jgi:phenol 2-monooxygenase
MAEEFTPVGADPDSLIDPVLVLSGKRTAVEQEQIPEYFTPVTGKWRMKGKPVPCLAFFGKRTVLTGRSDLHKVFSDDESYNNGHGHAYECYGIDPAVGAMVIVRPDQCEE